MRQILTRLLATLIFSSTLHAAPTTVKNEITVKEETILLSITGELDNFKDLAPRFREISTLYFKVWPEIVSMIGAPIDKTHRSITISFKTEMDHPAHAGGQSIVISAAHLRKNPSDTLGVFIHELTHIIQNHRGPQWIIEGVADYTRYKLKSDDAWGERCRKNIQYDKPFGAYWSSAAFLLYLEDTHKKPIVRPVSATLRAKTYDKSIWKKLTGKDLDTLAADYQSSGWKL